MSHSGLAQSMSELEQAHSPSSERTLDLEETSASVQDNVQRCRVLASHQHAPEDATSRLRLAALEGAGAFRIARACMSTFKLPLTYVVNTWSDHLDVHANPSPQAPVVRRLAPGEEVQGFPCGFWFRLEANEQSEPQWALLHNAEGLECYLIPQWGRVQAYRIVSVPNDTHTDERTEEIHVEWPGLPVANTTYSITWRSRGDATVSSESGTRQVGVACKTRLVGLPPQVRVRVEARVPALARPCLRFLGSWSDVLT